MVAKKRNPNGSGNITQRKDGRYELKVFVDSPDGRRKPISIYASTWEEADAECTRLKDLQRKGIPVDTTATNGKARCCAKDPAECCGQVAGTGTLRYPLRLVRAELQDAVEEELLARNVARQVKMPTGSIRKVMPWSAEEARTFLETARHDRLYALWAVALAIGLRRGEALGLRWVDVDLVNGRVVVTKALSRVGKILALRDVKTESSAASVPLPEELVTILRRHRLDQVGNTQVAQGNTLGLVFTTKNGTPLEPRNINRAFDTLCRRAGVRSIRLHDLRHSCATLLFTMGVEAATVQRVLRHSSISVTTGTYVDVIEQVQRSAVAGMDSLLNPAR